MPFYNGGTSGTTYNVGDVIEAINAPSSDWLEANGSFYNKGKYPALDRYLGGMYDVCLPLATSWTVTGLTSYGIQSVYTSSPYNERGQTLIPTTDQRCHILVSSANIVYGYYNTYLTNPLGLQTLKLSDNSITNTISLTMSAMASTANSGAEFDGVFFAQCYSGAQTAVQAKFSEGISGSYGWTWANFQSGVLYSASMNSAISGAVCGVVSVQGTCYLAQHNININNPYVSTAQLYISSPGSYAITNCFATAQNTAKTTIVVGTNDSYNGMSYLTIATSTTGYGGPYTDHILDSSATYGYYASCIRHNGSMFLVGSTNEYGNTGFWSSPDGITWTRRTLLGWTNMTTSPGNSNTSAFINVVGTTFVVGLMSTGGAGTTYSTSPDGIVWTSRAIPYSGNAASVTMSKDKDLLWVITQAGVIWNTADGINWNNITTINTGKFGPSSTVRPDWATTGSLHIESTGYGIRMYLDNTTKKWYLASLYSNRNNVRIFSKNNGNYFVMCVAGYTLLVVNSTTLEVVEHGYVGGSGIYGNYMLLDNTVSNSITAISSGDNRVYTLPSTGYHSVASTTSTMPVSQALFLWDVSNQPPSIINGAIVGTYANNVVAYHNCLYSTLATPYPSPAILLGKAQFGINASANTVDAANLGATLYTNVSNKAIVWYSHTYSPYFNKVVLNGIMSSTSGVTGNPMTAVTDGYSGFDLINPFPLKEYETYGAGVAGTIIPPIIAYKSAVYAVSNNGIGYTPTSVLPTCTIGMIRSQLNGVPEAQNLAPITAQIYDAAIIDGAPVGVAPRLVASHAGTGSIHHIELKRPEGIPGVNVFGLPKLVPNLPKRFWIKAQ
jgi:hypothetical protein